MQSKKITRVHMRFEYTAMGVLTPFSLFLPPLFPFPPLFSSAGEKNTRVYMRFGYKVMGQCTLSIDKDAEAGSGEFTEFYCMVREPGEHGSLVEK